MIPWLPAEPIFPPLASALTEKDGANGLLAAGGDLSPQRLLAAYRHGIFPWYSEGDPLLWWSPDPRMVLSPDQLNISRSLRKVLRHAEYEIRLDTAFAKVIRACARAPREGQNGTWISPEMQDAYIELHRLGYAHSVETWRDDALIGGLYGIAIGRAFFGESMFSDVTDASKIALAHLCEFLRQRDFGIIDCQMETTHLTSLGASLISRTEFIRRLDSMGVCPTVAEMQTDSSAPWSCSSIDGVFRKPIESTGLPP